MLRVIIESPFRGKTKEETDRNLIYLRRCISDSLKRGEAPFASHGFYPQVLKDSDPMERELGIRAGLVWHKSAQLIALYQDYGISEGMSLGIINAKSLSIPIWPREIGKNPSMEGGD